MPSLKTYRIIKTLLLEGETEVTVNEGVTPLITPDGTSIIIVEDITEETA